ncbi:MAG: hypothetical protein GWP03_02145 [Proteobacteria bacterium]|nr:hypothetical protein [Pseudomonadota bacterium]
MRNKYLHFDKEKSGRRIINILLSVLIVIILFFILKEVVGIISVEMKMNIIRKETKLTELRIDSLLKEEEKLKNDTFYIEKIAREQFGMAKKGEKVYIFIKSRKKNIFQRFIQNIKNH